MNFDNLDVKLQEKVKSERTHCDQKKLKGKTSNKLLILGVIHLSLLHTILQQEGLLTDLQ